VEVEEVDFMIDGMSFRNYLFLVFLVGAGCTNQEEVVLIPQCENIGDIDLENRVNTAVPFWIHNRTNDEVRLKVGGVPCVCTTIDIGSGSIPPHSKSKITIRIDPRKLSGHQTITAEIFSNHPAFPVFQPKVIGFFGLPKLQADYQVDMGIHYSSANFDSEFKLPLEQGLQPEEFLLEEPHCGTLQFAIHYDSGLPFLKVVGQLPKQDGGHQWVGKLKVAGYEKQATLKVKTTTTSYFDVPTELYFPPADLNSQPNIVFWIRKNYSRDEEVSMEDSYLVESTLGDKLIDLQWRQVAKDIELRLTARPGSVIGVFNDELTLRIKSSKRGEFEFKIPVTGRILGPVQASAGE